MDLSMYVETLRDHLVAAAEMGGSETKAVADQLSAGLGAATRLVLLEALSAAADEITRELAPGSVEVRLRGSNPDFVLTLPFDEDDAGAADASPTAPAVVPKGEEDGGTSRLNLRLPEGLKTRIEEAARREGLSLNAWLIRVAAAAVERTDPVPPRSPIGGQRYTGWVR